MADITPRDELETLAAKVEAAEGADDALAMEIAWLDYRTQGGIGLGVNYDPVLWMERHGLDPTASLDAAMTLVPEGWAFEVWRSDSGKEAIAGCAPTDPQLAVSDPAECYYEGDATTPALALCAAALRARASALTGYGEKGE